MYEVNTRLECILGTTCKPQTKLYHRAGGTVGGMGLICSAIDNKPTDPAASRTTSPRRRSNSDGGGGSGGGDSDNVDRDRIQDGMTGETSSSLPSAPLVGESLFSEPPLDPQFTEELMYWTMSTTFDC